MKFQEFSQQIPPQASQCVKCGLCLPHCPTYQLTQNECESPRGRIALMDSLARQRLPLTDKLKTYLDHCLSCSACEAVCPTKVPYTKMLNTTRSFIKQKPMRVFSMGIINPWILKISFYLLKFYQRSGLQKLVCKTKLLEKLGLARLEAYLPRLKSPARLKSYYPPVTPEQGQVALFTGCINPFLDAETLDATLKVLTFYGYGVHIPEQQVCCGALQLHAGYPEKTAFLQEKNHQAFQTKSCSAIISIASGCHAVLAEQSFSIPIIDISQFISKLEQPPNLEILPLKKRVSLHTPCTLRNAVKQASAAATLLQKIPEIDLVELSTPFQCCGAAGANMLKFPEIADDLLLPFKQQIKQQDPEMLLTSNIGCALHFIKNLPNSLKITHPITLFAEQLQIKKQ